MILLDANILLYAYHAGSPRHADASAWIEEAFSGTEPVRLPWATIHAFLRIGTNQRVFEHPLGIDEALAKIPMDATVGGIRKAFSDIYTDISKQSDEWHKAQKAAKKLSEIVGAPVQAPERLPIKIDGLQISIENHYDDEYLTVWA